MHKTTIHVSDIKHIGKRILCDTAIKGINWTLERGQSVVIFVNKKGMHTGVVCVQCGYIPYCNQCDIPISLHQNHDNHLFGLCPICQNTYQVPNNCAQCGHDDMQRYGVGIQQVVDFCKKNFDVPVISIQSSNSNSHPKIQQLFAQIQTAPSIIVATSLLQYPICDIGLLIFQNALHISVPDYNVELRNYHFLYNAITGYKAPYAIIQTYQPNHIIIQSITQDNPALFLTKDEEFKQKHHYPPYGEMCILSYKHVVETSLFGSVNTLFHDILALRQQGGYTDIQVYAIPAMIYKIYGKYRYQIIIKGKHIRSFVDTIFTTLKPYQKGFKFDWGAQSFF